MAHGWHRSVFQQNAFGWVVGNLENISVSEFYAGDEAYLCGVAHWR
jgi:hypothetical protein